MTALTDSPRSSALPSLVGAGRRVLSDLSRSVCAAVQRVPKPDNLALVGHGADATGLSRR